MTGQVGYAWGQWLLYGKGGVGWTQLALDANNPNPGGLDANAKQTIAGGTGGVRLEYLLTRNLGLGIEYDFYGFRAGNILNLANSGGIVLPCGFCNFGNTNVQTLTARLNWRFDW